MNKNIVEPSASVRSIAEVAKKRINNNYIVENKSKININDKIYNYTRKIILSSIRNNYFNYIDNENLFDKIFNLISNDKNIQNPLGKLIDENYYLSQNKDNQQRYILKLSHIYILIKQTYLKVESLIENEIIM